ncbi:MAG TPA: hypothetical protein VK891_02745 [Euzebyales bacterium]|nr:hypothetical protein [Euzebyales bacterium]
MINTTDAQPAVPETVSARRPPAVAAALGLFVLSPLIAEYLLGNVTIGALGYLLIFAPLYGAGALLVREITRRTGRGWPTMILLGLAYALVEEGLLTQTLFNPSYLGLDLLATAHVNALGIGAWWTLFVLTLHTVWSTSVSIALVEALAVRHRTTPWLGWPGLAVTAVVYLLGAALIALGTYAEERFVAAPAQLLGVAVVVVAVIIAAFAVPQRRPVPHSRPVPSPWVVGAVAFVASSVFMGVSMVLPTRGSAADWLIVGLYAGLYAVVIALVRRWSPAHDRDGWDDRHRLALAGGALLTYVWYGWPARPAVGAMGQADLVGNAVFSLGALVLLAVAAARVRGER